MCWNNILTKYNFVKGPYQKYLNKCAVQFCKESWGWTGSSLGTGDTAGEHNLATKQIIFNNSERWDNQH